MKLQEQILGESSTMYVGNLSYYSTEEQVNSSSFVTLAPTSTFYCSISRILAPHPKLSSQPYPPSSQPYHPSSQPYPPSSQAYPPYPCLLDSVLLPPLNLTLLRPLSLLSSYSSHPFLSPTLLALPPSHNSTLLPFSPTQFTLPVL